jgi:hypothetical protein
MHTRRPKGDFAAINPLSFSSTKDTVKGEPLSYTNLETAGYNVCIWNMFTQIQMHDKKAWVSGAALKKCILNQVPHIMLERTHMVGLSGRTDQKIIDVITNTCRTAEKCNKADNKSGLRKSISDVPKES